MVVRLLDRIGRLAIEGCERMGMIGIFLIDSFRTMVTTRLRVKKVFYHMQYIGVSSLTVVALVGMLGGAVLALQSYIGLHRFGQEQFVGPIVYLSMLREFGPVFTAIMVIGRAGSAMTAEIGTMRITEQIDALQTLCIDVHQYLIVPRIIAGTVILPFLSICCVLFGVTAGYITSVYILDINPEIYSEAVRAAVELSDFTSGLIKATAFGFLLTVISTYKGYITKGGSKGVGIATTESVVYSNVTVFAANYILTSFLF